MMRTRQVVINMYLGGSVENRAWPWPELSTPTFTQKLVWAQASGRINCVERKLSLEMKLPGKDRSKRMRLDCSGLGSAGKWQQCSGPCSGRGSQATSPKWS